MPESFGDHRRISHLWRIAGRDLEAIAIGLNEVMDENYLQYRIRSIEYLANKLISAGVPVMQPAGGHAVYLDAKKFLAHIPVEQYPGQALVGALYLQGGIRSVEIGSLMFGKYDEHEKSDSGPAGTRATRHSEKGIYPKPY